MEDATPGDERPLLVSCRGVTDAGQMMEVTFGDDHLLLSAVREGDVKDPNSRQISFDSLVCYDGRPWRDEGPDWCLHLRTVSWRWFIAGKTFSLHSFRLVVPPDFVTTEMNVIRAYCMEVLFAIDKRVSFFGSFFDFFSIFSLRC
jgi:hypothetical protein